jgi:hypothetical protein
LQERVDARGKVMVEDSYTRLAELAKDPAAWDHAWDSESRIAGFIDWQKTRPKVLAANGDRALIAKALAEYESKGSGRSGTVEKAVGETGIRFEFPDVVADQKPIYDSLVASNPLAHPRLLVNTGDKPGAIAELKDADKKLGDLSRKIQMHQDAFTNSTDVAEMFQRISSRRTDLRAEIRKLSPPAAAPASLLTGKVAALAPGKAEQDAKAAQEAEAVRREERNALIQDYIPQCLTLQEREQANFAKVKDELESFSFWGKLVKTIRIFNLLNKTRDSYPKWDRMVDKLREVYKERGESPDRANQFAPNRGQWQALRDKADRL